MARTREEHTVAREGSPMKRLVAIVVLMLTVIALVVPPAHAHGGAAASAALALGAFAAFNILFSPLWRATACYPPLYPAPAPAVYAPPAYRPAVVRYATASPAPLVHREVVYANGRYVLYGDGVRRPYQWVWVPGPPPPPPAPPTR